MGMIFVACHVEPLWDTHVNSLTWSVYGAQDLAQSQLSVKIIGESDNGCIGGFAIFIVVASD